MEHLSAEVRVAIDIYGGEGVTIPKDEPIPVFGDAERVIRPTFSCAFGGNRELGQQVS